MTVREVIRAVEADGWVMVKRTGSSHRQVKHPTKPGRVTINGASGDVLDAWLWASIKRQAGL
jgi:predicted RNA binding protein YcfA (HicA-like mRNA interferase family)